MEQRQHDRYHPAVSLHSASSSSGSREGVPAGWQRPSVCAVARGLTEVAVKRGKKRRRGGEQRGRASWCSRLIVTNGAVARGNRARLDALQWDLRSAARPGDCLSHCLSVTFHCLSLAFPWPFYAFHCLSPTFRCLSLPFLDLPLPFPDLSLPSPHAGPAHPLSQLVRLVRADDSHGRDDNVQLPRPGQWVVHAQNADNNSMAP